MHVKAKVTIIKRTLVTFGVGKLWDCKRVQDGLLGAGNILFLDFIGDYVIICFVINHLTKMLVRRRLLFCIFHKKVFKNLLTCCCMNH